MALDDTKKFTLGMIEIDCSVGQWRIHSSFSVLGLIIPRKLHAAWNTEADLVRSIF